MGTPTTIGAIPTGCGCCAAECDDAGADRRIGGQDSATPFTFAALYRAWQACRRGKRGTRKAQRYETRLLDNLVDTAQALQEHTWRPSRAIRFITIHPKPREILASEIGDRVVHHLLVRRYVVPGGFRRVRDQYRWFRRQFPHDVLLIGEQAQPGMPIRGRWPTARVAWHEAENKQ